MGLNVPLTAQGHNCFRAGNREKERPEGLRTHRRTAPIGLKKLANMRTDCCKLAASLSEADPRVTDLARHAIPGWLPGVQLTAALPSNWYFPGVANGTRTLDPHTARVKPGVLARIRVSNAYRIVRVGGPFPCSFA